MNSIQERLSALLGLGEVGGDKVVNHAGLALPHMRVFEPKLLHRVHLARLNARLSRLQFSNPGARRLWRFYLFKGGAIAPTRGAECRVRAIGIMTDTRWREHGLFFFHCPKAAGTSLRSQFLPHFAPAEHSPDIEHDVFLHQQNKQRLAKFRGYKFYFGHFGRDVYEAVRMKHVPMTNFRSPADRIFSLFLFFRRNETDDALLTLPNLYPLLVAKKGGLRDFVLSDDPRITVYTRNHHARQLSLSGWELDASAALDRSTEILAQMPWFYVFERQSESIVWAQEAIGITLEANVHLNSATERRRDIDALKAEFEPLRERVLELNALDMEIYERAIARLDRVSARGTP